jgi:uncharacterized protein (TIGR02599 family)
MWTSPGTEPTVDCGRPAIACPCSARRVGSQAFTLLEILVSVTILVMLITLLGQILSGATQARILGETNTERMENVRAINDSIVGELQAALLPTTPSSQTSLQFIVNPSGAPGISGATFGNRDAIFWQAPLSNDQRLGDVAEIGYFVHWDTTTKPSNPRARMCRFFLNPVQSGTSTIAAESKYLVYSTPGAWLSDDLIKSVTPIIASSGSSSPSSYVGLFAENVLGLWIRCLDRGSNTIATDAGGTAFVSGAFPSGTGYDSRRGYYDSNDPDHIVIKRLPSSVDVSYVIVDSSAASRITPEIQQAIIDLYKSADNAEGFVRQAQADSQKRFKAISSSLRPYQIRVYLQNSR